MDGLRPFFSYFGSKWGAANRYPVPRYETIIEPFAGSAGYSLRYYRQDVILYDIDPVICGIWKFLIRSGADDILRLPTEVETTDDIQVCQEAKDLIGFWLNRAVTRPRRRPTGWAKREALERNGNSASCYWGKEVRQRITQQVRYIKHWKVYEKGYHDVDTTQEATYFVDPPYQGQGHQYVYSDISYKHLALWCTVPRGQVIVCEQSGANWLPFRHLYTMHTAKQTDSRQVRSKERKRSEEMIWTND